MNPPNAPLDGAVTRYQGLSNTAVVSRHDCLSHPLWLCQPAVHETAFLFNGGGGLEAFWPGHV